MQTAPPPPNFTVYSSHSWSTVTQSEIKIKAGHISRSQFKCIKYPHLEYREVRVKGPSPFILRKSRPLSVICYDNRIFQYSQLFSCPPHSWVSHTIEAWCFQRFCCSNISNVHNWTSAFIHKGFYTHRLSAFIHCCCEGRRVGRWSW